MIFWGVFGGFLGRNFFEGSFLEELFWRKFLEGIFGKIFLGGIFVRNFLRGFFERNSLGGILTLLKSAARLFEYGRNLLLCQDFGFCQDFVKILSKSKKEGIILNP